MSMLAIRRTSAVLLPVLVSACVMSACAGARTGAEPAPVDTSSADVGVTGADDLVIRVRYVGGYTSAVEIATRMPVISVYGDGRVITEGVVTAIYPGPALPATELRKISRDEVAALVRRALAAGVGSATDFGRPGVIDAADTQFTVATTDGVKETSVYSLDQVDDRPQGQLTEGQRAARTKLRTFLDELREPAGESQRYPVSSLAVVSIPYTEPKEPPVLAPVAWTGPALPGEPLGTNGSMGCVSVSGDAAKTALAAAESAKSVTPWTSGGKSYFIRFRPLLPHEKGCADLASQR